MQKATLTSFLSKLLKKKEQGYFAYKTEMQRL